MTGRSAHIHILITKFAIAHNCHLSQLVTIVKNGENFHFLSGALGNGLKQLELSKVGLIAHPMQNSVRNMIGTLVLMCGGLIMSKLRILDGLWKGDFNLVGIPVWREIQITDMS